LINRNPNYFLIIGSKQGVPKHPEKLASEFKKASLDHKKKGFLVIVLVRMRVYGKNKLQRQTKNSEINCD